MSDLFEKTGVIAITKFAVEELFIEDLVWSTVVNLTEVLAHVFFFLPF